MFTAPHGCLLRAVKDSKLPLMTQRNHKIELYTSTIVISLAREINKLLKGSFCSFATWLPNNLKKVKPTDLDPNYLCSSQTKINELPFSVFHQTFHKFILGNLKDKSKANVILKNRINRFEEFDSKDVLPMFHIDIHGKLPSDKWTQVSRETA